jgi:ribonuclease Z
MAGAMKVTFLGTGGSYPTAWRNVAAHHVRVKGESLLFDCGEGTQRQLQKSAAAFSANRIFISHTHLDHVSGLPGYLGTLGLLRRVEPVRIYGPLGSRAYLQVLVGLAGGLDYEVSIQELDHGEVVASEGFQVRAARVEHAGLCLAFRVEEDLRRGSVDPERARALGVPPGPALGRLLEEGTIDVSGRTVRREDVVGPSRPGRVVVYSGDTRPCPSLEELSRGADLLIHDATFESGLAAEAVARAHSTSTEAARTALAAGAKRLALTHVSPRHQEAPDELLRQAKQIFPESFLPQDLDSLEIPLG